MTVTELHRLTLGGSEIAAAAGIDPYMSAIELAARKLGEIPERDESEAMLWGKRLEPLVAYAVEHDAGYEVIPAPLDGFRDGWRSGRPDAFTTSHEERAVLEIKTMGQYARNVDAVPIQYQAQCQWYMSLTDTRRAVVAVLVGGQRLEIHELERNDHAIDILTEAGAAFVKLVKRGRKPEPDSSDSARNTLLLLHPEHAPGKRYRLTREEWHVLRGLRDIREAEARIKEQRQAAENVLKAAMADAESAVSPHDEEVVSWRTVRAGRIDTKALRSAHPDIAEEFTTHTNTRRFTLS